MFDPQGSGVVGARIIINSRHVATTTQQGTYHLDSMKPGLYRISVEAPRITFNEVEVKVTPNTPQLPSIIASSWAYFLLPLVIFYIQGDFCLRFSWCGSHVKPQGDNLYFKMLENLTAVEDMSENWPEVRELSGKIFSGKIIYCYWYIWYHLSEKPGMPRNLPAVMEMLGSWPRLGNVM